MKRQVMERDVMVEEEVDLRQYVPFKMGGALLTFPETTDLVRNAEKTFGGSSKAYKEA